LPPLFSRKEAASMVPDDASGTAQRGRRGAEPVSWRGKSISSAIIA
jgi:hypothetical protein